MTSSLHMKMVNSTNSQFETRRKRSFSVSFGECAIDESICENSSSSSITISSANVGTLSRINKKKRIRFVREFHHKSFECHEYNTITYAATVSESKAMKVGVIVDRKLFTVCDVAVVFAMTEH